MGGGRKREVGVRDVGRGREKERGGREGVRERGGNEGLVMKWISRCSCLLHDLTDVPPSTADDRPMVLGCHVQV